MENGEVEVKDVEERSKADKQMPQELCIMEYVK